MSSSAFEQGGDRYYREDSSKERSREDSSDRPPDRRLLDEVLRETLSPESSVSAEELEALLAVARRHRGERLTVEPVAVDLVQSVLQFRFANLKIDPSTWREMARQIADTLMDDETSSGRLERFWNRLREALG